MKKLITLSTILLALAASSAQAQVGLNLNWGDCTSGGSGTQDMTFACNTNSGVLFTMHASIIVPEAMPSFASTTTVVDIHVNDVTLPPWWLTTAGQCRNNSIGISYDPNNNTSACTDLWQSATNLQVSAIQQGLHGANSVRVNGVAAVPSGSELNVAADGSELWVCRVTINRANTLTCAGCLTPACIVLNEMYMQQPGGLPAYRVTDQSTNRWVTWQGGGGTNCPTDTPTMNRTWGAVKGLYR